MNSPKRRAKRRANHSKNGNKPISEKEDKLLTLIAGILVDIILKEMDEEERARIEEARKYMFKGDNQTGFKHP